ncbi:MAG: hypothetical protein WBC44_04235 [Planctomycetaceae bacterium]
MLRTLFAPLLRPMRRRAAEAAIAAWPSQRHDVESQFAVLAAAAGTPRGLLWNDCEWNGQTRFARERASGLLTAFEAVVVRFEAVEGGEMEGVAAVSLPRDATAVFHFRQGRWGTGGRTLFNMTPDETLERFVDQFEPIDGDSTRSSGV